MQSEDHKDRALRDVAESKVKPEPSSLSGYWMVPNFSRAGKYLI